MAARRAARRSQKRCSVTRRVALRVGGGDNMLLKSLVVAVLAWMFEAALDVLVFHTAPWHERLFPLKPRLPLMHSGTSCPVKHCRRTSSKWKEAPHGSTSHWCGDESSASPHA